MFEAAQLDLREIETELKVWQAAEKVRFAVDVTGPHRHFTDHDVLGPFESGCPR
ncbi:MAG TPA: hypothetical protein VGJ88_02605 [Thermoanaerobaculia bacterium]